MSMIPAVLRTGLMNLRRDRPALGLVFLLPIAFFSIFAIIFGGQRNSTPRVRVVVVDEDRSETSGRLVEALKNEPGLVVMTAPKGKPGETPAPYDAKSAEAVVRAGDAPVALVIPRGFGQAAFSFDPRKPRTPVQLLKDSGDPIAPQMVMGLLQKAATTSMPDSMAAEGFKYFEQAAGGLTPQQRRH